MRKMIIIGAMMLGGCYIDKRDPDVERAAMQECLESSGSRVDQDIMIQCRSFAADVARQAAIVGEKKQDDPVKPRGPKNEMN